MGLQDPVGVHRKIAERSDRVQAGERRDDAIETLRRPGKGLGGIMHAGFDELRKSLGSRLLPQPFDRPRRDVNADHSNVSLSQKQGLEARPAGDVQDPVPDRKQPHEPVPQDAPHPEVVLDQPVIG